MKTFPVELVLPIIVLIFGVYYGLGSFFSRRYQRRMGIPATPESPAVSRRKRLIAGGLTLLCIVNVVAFALL